MTDTLNAATRPRWTDLATVGFLLAALGPLLLLAAILGWGLETDGEAGFFGIIIGIAAAGALVVRLRPMWTKIIAIFLAVLLFLGLWWTIFGLLAGPANFFDFMSGVLVMPGALLAAVSSIGAFVAGRRGRVGTKAEAGERTAIRVSLVVVALAAIVSGILTFATRSTVDDASTAAATVRMTDFEFSPTEVEVAGGSSVLVRNDDPFLHTFTVDELDIDETITIGSEKLIRIPSEPGTYVLYCVPHTGDREDPDENDMVGTLRVT